MALESDFLNRLLEAGAAESSGCSPSCHPGNDVASEQSSTINVLQKFFLPSSELWHVNNEFVSAALTKLQENGSFCTIFSVAV
jgi:E3 ubiquitin-protein ligase BRE1